MGSRSGVRRGGMALISTLVAFGMVLGGATAGAFASASAESFEELPPATLETDAPAAAIGAESGVQASATAPYDAATNDGSSRALAAAEVGAQAAAVWAEEYEIGRVRITWDNGGYNGRMVVSFGYQTPAGNFVATQHDAGTATAMEFTIPTAHRGVLHSVQVFAYYYPGPTIGSVLFQAKTFAPTVRAEAPATLDVNWGAVWGATGYTVEYRPSGGAWSGVDVGAATSHQLTGLFRGTEYEVRVVAQGVETSTTVTGRTPEVAVPVTSASTPDTITLQWNRADVPPEIDSLRITMAGGQVQDVDPAAESAVFAGLIPNTAYRFEVTARRGERSVGTTVVDATTAALEFAAPGTIGEYEHSVRLRLDDPQVRPGDVFRIDQRISGSTDWVQVAEGQDDQPEIGNLTPFTSYEFRYRVIRAGHEVGASRAAEARTIGAVDLTAALSGPGTVHLAWDTAVPWELALYRDGVWIAGVPANATEFTDAVLPGYGDAVYELADRVVVGTARVAIPPLVLAPVVSDVTSTTARVSWTAPVIPDALRALPLQYRVFLDGSRTPATVTTDTSWNIQVLLANTHHTARVEAYLLDGPDRPVAVGEVAFTTLGVTVASKPTPLAKTGTGTPLAKTGMDDPQPLILVAAGLVMAGGIAAAGASVRSAVRRRG